MPQHGAVFLQMAAYRLLRPVSDERPSRCNSIFLCNDSRWSRFHLKGIAFSNLVGSQESQSGCLQYRAWTPFLPLKPSFEHLQKSHYRNHARAVRVFTLPHSSGVPQGSVPGPALFSLDLLHCEGLSSFRERDISCQCRAGDLQVYSSASPTQLDACVVLRHLTCTISKS